MNNNEINSDIYHTLQKLLNLNFSNENKIRSKVFAEKIGDLLEKIPQFIEYLNEDNLTLNHHFFVEFGKYVMFDKIQKGETIQHVCEGDKFFYMITTGRIVKLNIKYKNLYTSLKDYILFLIKLFLLNEKYLYNDCIKKNQGVFPISENIDIIKYIDKLKYFDFKNEINEIINMKENILLNNNDEKIQKNINISDLLLLYNPNIEIGGKNHFLNKEMKFSVNLPFFYIDQIMEPISFIGHLNKNRGIKNYSLYICLSNCDVFYINKEKINGDDPLYYECNLKKSEIITNKLFRTHFLFKDMDISFLSKNYSKYFEIINVSKGDCIIYQGNAYEGVYFIINGMMQLKSNRSYNELTDLNYCTLNNLINKINNKDNFNNFTDKKKVSIHNKLINNPLFIKKSNQKKEIYFGTYTNNEIIGLNDIYDKKTGIYNYTVQCLTNEAELFFLPKEIFASLIKIQEIYDKLLELTQEKNNLLKLKIQKYKNLFELEFERFLSPENDNKNELYFKINNSNNKYHHISNQNIINRLLFKREKKNFYDNYNKKSKSKSATVISKDNIPKKKIIDFSKKFKNYSTKNDANQSKNSFSNSLVINNELTNESIILNNIHKNTKTIKQNAPRILLYLNNNNVNIDSKNARKNDNKSKTLNHFFNESNKSNISNNNNKNKPVVTNKLIKSSSIDNCGKIKKNMEDILQTNNFKLKKKINNNELMIPFIKSVKSKQFNYDIYNINYKLKRDGKVLNVLQKKTTNNNNPIP